MSSLLGVGGGLGLVLAGPILNTLNYHCCSGSRSS